ncbi:hypothetical protein [Methylobacillus flagellatus]|uniref:Uncharacterized protein n=1 Tax=Methylobacillus flagellatus (strain ATCC 51484 / DSM 6875 / VKM B-1610 / KT) TaxID=265072 RepID=Q1GXS5_METFK|nr:hypothetical protein [Methylobacillus flagellatus]ABE50962.1 hypothetical protein Mfla_2699 [Methylobacillus flagellatus KT]
MAELMMGLHTDAQGKVSKKEIAVDAQGRIMTTGTGGGDMSIEEVKTGLEGLSGDSRLDVLAVKGAAHQTADENGKPVITSGGVDYALTPNASIGKGKNYLIYPGVTILSMTGLATTDFQYGGSTSVRSMDTDNKWFPGSTQVFDVTNTGGSGAGLNITRNLPAPVAALGEAPNMCIPIWVEDYTKMGSVEIRFSMDDIAFDNYYRATWGVNPNGNNSLKRNGWHFAFFAPSDFVAVGSPTWEMTINAVRFYQLNASGVTAPNGGHVKYDSIIFNYRAMANFCYMIDGTQESLGSFVRPLCNSLGIPLTVSLTVQNIIGQPGYVSLETLHGMAREGTTFVPRNPIRVGDPGATTNAQVSAGLKASQDYIRTIFRGVVPDATIERWLRHWTCANGVNAFTQGDRSLFDYLAEHNGIVTARTTDTTNGPMMIPQGYGQDNLHQMPIIDGWPQADSVFMASLDKTIARNAMAIAFTHGVDHNTIVTYKNLEARLKYAKAKAAAGLLKFRTLPDWYDGL